ncbi:unnamed protein product [Boreogadus saida]
MVDPGPVGHEEVGLWGACCRTDSETDISGQSLENSPLSETDISGQSLENSPLSETDISGQSLENSLLSETDITRLCSSPNFSVPLSYCPVLSLFLSYGPVSVPPLLSSRPVGVSNTRVSETRLVTVTFFHTEACSYITIACSSLDDEKSDTMECLGVQMGGWGLPLTLTTPIPLTTPPLAHHAHPVDSVRFPRRRRGPGPWLVSHGQMAV